jgi:hypothetical protein
VNDVGPGKSQPQACEACGDAQDQHKPFFHDVPSEGDNKEATKLREISH